MGDNKVFFRGYIEIDVKRVEDLLRRIDEAQEEIYRCYGELREMGVVKFKKEPPEEPAK